MKSFASFKVTDVSIYSGTFCPRNKLLLYAVSYIRPIIKNNMNYNHILKHPLKMFLLLITVM